MAERFLTSRDIQALVGLTTPKAAERLMDDWKVPFIHLGRGRGRGRRWSEVKVLAAIRVRERDPGAETKPKSRKKDATQSFFSLSVKDMISLTQRGTRA